MEWSVTVRLQVLLFAIFMLGVAAQSQKKNPFLLQKQEMEQHFEEQKKLQQLQIEQAQQQNLQGGSRPQQQEHRPPPPPPKYRSRSSHVTHNPFTRPQDSGRSHNHNHNHNHNRNEMHKNGPGPTPWTRWTEKPRPKKSPWEDKNSKSEMAECDGRPYNARELICCQGTVKKRQGLRPACCGDASFDFVFNLCCDGKVTPRTAGRPFC